MKRLRLFLNLSLLVAVLAACDPANAYGAALPWPARPDTDGESDGRKGHQPGRKAGATVVLMGP